MLALVHALWPDPVFAERARETVGWLRREMRVAEAFAASLDADQDGEEGAFYVWREAEIDAALGEASPAVQGRLRRHAAAETGKAAPCCGGSRRAARTRTSARSRKRAPTLFALREQRPRPARDDKVLADWNGLTIAALARASAVFGEPEWFAHARAAYYFITRILRTDDDGLFHAWRAARPGALGLLDDYASVARAALALFEGSGDPGELETARQLAADALDRFGDGEGGVYLTAADAADVPGARPRHAHDGAIPSGVGLLARGLGAALASDGRAALARGRRRAHPRLLRRARGDRRQPAPLDGGRHARARRLRRRRRAARRSAGAGAGDGRPPRPGSVADRAAPRPPHLAERARRAATCRASESPVAMLCQGQTCSLPVATPEALAALLGERAAGRP